MNTTPLRDALEKLKELSTRTAFRTDEQLLLIEDAILAIGEFLLPDGGGGLRDGVYYYCQHSIGIHEKPCPICFPAAGEVTPGETERKDKRICHFPGERCAGCPHYYNKADTCSYAPVPTPPANATQEEQERYEDTLGHNFPVGAAQQEPEVIENYHYFAGGPSTSISSGAAQPEAREWWIFTHNDGGESLYGDKDACMDIGKWTHVREVLPASSERAAAERTLVEACIAVRLLNGTGAADLAPLTDKVIALRVGTSFADSLSARARQSAAPRPTL